MRLIKVFFYVMAAVSLSACSNDDNDIIENTAEQPLPLTITVSENPLQNPNTPGQVSSTRTAVTTTSSLSSFTLDYQYTRGGELQSGYVDARKDGSGNWSAGNWPDAGGDTEVNWYAHTGGTIVNQTAPYLKFTVEELSTNQKDLLVATAAGTKNATGGNLSFTFDHACTALQFYVKKATNLKDFTLTVTSIKICNIVKEGNYDLATSTWTPGGSRTQYTLYEGSGLTLGTTDYTLLNANADDYLFMIPQILTPWDTSTAIASAGTQSYIQLECTISGATSYSGTAYIPFSATVDAGVLNNVKINIGRNSLYSGPATKIIN